MNRPNKKQNTANNAGTQNGKDNPFLASEKKPQIRVPLRERFVQRKRGTYATIDLGTNNCRMLIARPSPHSFNVVESFSRITRLGESLIENNILTKNAMDRTIKALDICAKKLAKRPVSQARHVATEACRRAENASEFVDRVYTKTGIKLEIISPEEEARLAVAGCVPLLARNIEHTLVFDIGGGSTEISWAKVSPNGHAEVEAVISLPFGVVTVSEAFAERTMDETAFAAVIDRTSYMLKQFEKEHRILDEIDKDNVQMIGTSGTVTTLGAIHLDLPRYNRNAVDGLTLSFEEIEHIQSMLKRMSYSKRIKHPCIGPGRADLTMAGSAILEAICAFWPTGEITVADRGLREGVLLDLMQKENERVTSTKGVRSHYRRRKTQKKPT